MLRELRDRWENLLQERRKDGQRLPPLELLSEPIRPHNSLVCDRVLVHALRTDDWDIIIQVFVTCSEAVNDWEISGIIRHIKARITQSSNLRREDFKALRDIDNLSGKHPTPTKMTRSKITALIGEIHFLFHPAMKSSFTRRDWNEGNIKYLMRIFGELITDSEIFCLGWKISTFPKLLRTPQGGRSWSRCRQLTGDKGH